MERRFGQYILLERIGSGGMAEVFRARMEGQKLFARGENAKYFSREIAIKLILPHLSREDSFRELFSREAHLASLLDHPNIVAIQDYGTLDETDYIVMEYVRGMDLRKLLRCISRGQRLPLAESISILYRISRGLAYAHDRKVKDAPDGIIHRDLSPHNILISTEGEIKIADFGIARAVKADATRTTGFKGKLSYMSPEQVEGGFLDNRSDLFSFGTISYQLLTGEHPFTRGSDAATLKAVQEADYPPIPDSAGIPEEARALVKRILHVHPDYRPSSAHEIAAGFEPFLEPLSDINLGRRVSEQKKELLHEQSVSTTAATLPRPKPRLSPIAVAAGLMVIISIWLITSLSGTKKFSSPEVSEPQNVVKAPASPVETSAQVSAEPIVIRTTPPGARITVNGRDMGISPVSASQGTDGKTLEIEASLYGYAPVTRKLSPAMGSAETKINLIPLPTASVRIGAKPWAGVYYRGNLVDYTPALVSDVPVGKRTFTLKNETLGVVRRVTLDIKSGNGNIISEDLTVDVR